MPDRKRLGHVNVICGCYVHMCGREGGKKGATGTEQGAKNGAIDSEHEGSKGRGSQLCTKCSGQKKIGIQ